MLALCARPPTKTPIILENFEFIKIFNSSMNYKKFYLIKEKRKQSFLSCFIQLQANICKLPDHHR